ncbi:hypothetical protein [Ensifer soli]|uniref:hypothetical protein n=1 Tax=Ciceribacter sp. sgz301302 TaxID=3342379 RepID=UPI0035BA64FD
MFYLGGMSLGYFTAPLKRGKTHAPEDRTVREARPERTETVDREREIEFERAFMTPWHLFY